jgi:hypothetical protein
MGASRREPVGIGLSHRVSVTMATLCTEVSCPICGEDGSVLAHGVIAPFVSELSSLPLGERTTLRSCATCDFSFFDSRYGDHELASLYGHYRDSEYKTIRHHWEPWYSRNVNDAFSTGNDEVEERLSFMMRSLDAAHMKSRLNCAVDFGGDEGQFFPKVPIDRRIVCDVSNRDLPPGIEHIATLSELGEVKPDLVIIAHVLEHLPDPLLPLREIRRAIADDGIIYVEIPLDRFRVHPFHASSRYRTYIQALVRHRLPFVGSDFMSGLSRQFRSSIPRFGVVKQSEHINYFSSRSVAAALDASGFTVVAHYADENAKAGGLRMGCYGVAAKPS